MERRIEALERLLGNGPEEDLAELERRHEEFKVTLGRVYEKAAREEAEGNPARRIALDELGERMRERIRERAGW